MPRVTNVETILQTERHTLTIRTRTKAEDLPQLIGKAYKDLWGYLAEKNELVIDMPFVAYHNMDMQDLDVEIGVVVKKAMPEKGAIKPGIIPEARALLCIHRGAYDQVCSTYEDMLETAKTKGYEIAGVAYEYYYNAPDEFPMDEMLTRIVLPVK